MQHNTREKNLVGNLSGYAGDLHQIPRDIGLLCEKSLEEKMHSVFTRFSSVCVDARPDCVVRLYTRKCTSKHS